MEKNKRTKNIKRIGALSFLLNLLLFFTKLFAGLTANSIAIINDAINNLNDSLSAFVFSIGFRLSTKAADDNHPQGHGRGEYITALIVGFVIIFVAVQFFIQSILRIINPIMPSYAWFTIVVLAISIAIKIMLGFVHYWQYRHYQSLASQAIAIDSFTDVFMSILVLVGVFIQPLVSFPLDGVLGVIVAAFIFFSGLNVIKNAIQYLLGKPLQEDAMIKIKNLVNDNALVLGSHSYVYHDYGPTNQMLSLHLEVNQQASLTETHDLIDALENEIKLKFNIDVIVHLDPMLDEATQNVILKPYREMIKAHQIGINIAFWKAIQTKTRSEIILAVHTQNDRHVLAAVLQEKFPSTTFVIEVVPQAQK
jgi:cation diffusion facilitator family transporter